MVTEIEWATAVEQMRKAGREAGKASGSWIADGNTDEATLRRVLKQWDDGDPCAPCPPSPFSGEWAGDASLQEVIEQETDLIELAPEEEDELATAFEEEFSGAWQDEAERTVRAMLPD